MGPDEKVTLPAMPAVDPWARMDRIEVAQSAHAEKCAERFGKIGVQIEIAADKCLVDTKMLSAQIADNAKVARALEARFVEFEKWQPGVDASVKRAGEDAAEAKRVAETSVNEMKGTAAGLVGILSKAETATAEREDAKRVDRASDKANRELAQATHAARFEAQGDALRRQAAGIVTVGEAVTQLASRALLAFVVVALVVIGGVVVVVATVLVSRPTELTVAPHPRAAGESR